MKLRKALEITNYYAYLILKGDIVSLESLEESEDSELEEARDTINDFLEQFK